MVPYLLEEGNNKSRFWLTTLLYVQGTKVRKTQTAGQGAESFAH